MAAEEQAMNITKCTRCHMRHKDDMFDTNRLGEKFKTCNTCREKNRASVKAYKDNNPGKVKKQQEAYSEKNKDKIAERSKAYKENNKCEHGVYKNTCYTCASGPMFCEHKLPRKSCLTCTPLNFCKHSKRLDLKCRGCNPELFCNHNGGQQKEYCHTCRQDSKKINPELHCAIDGHFGWVNKCCQCKCVENNNERLRLKEAAEEPNE